MIDKQQTFRSHFMDIIKDAPLETQNEWKKFNYQIEFLIVPMIPSSVLNGLKGDILSRYQNIMKSYKDGTMKLYVAPK